MKAEIMPTLNASHKVQPYHAYMLRIWREDSTDEPIWRASLQSVQSQETVRFRSLAELCDFLLKEFLASKGKEGEP